MPTLTGLAPEEINDLLALPDPPKEELETPAYLRKLGLGRRKNHLAEVGKHGRKVPHA